MAADLDKWIEQLKKCEPISEAHVKLLCHLALDVLVEEGNVQQVAGPVTICALPVLLAEHSMVGAAGAAHGSRRVQLAQAY